ncbi:MAG: sensor histidine kinase [Lachnospiraceae bacterium]
MKFFISYLKEKKLTLIFYVCFCFLLSVSFLLYHLPLGAVAYPILLCGLIGVCFFAADFCLAKKKHKQLTEFQRLFPELLEQLPVFPGITDEDYRAIIYRLLNEQQRMTARMASRYNNMTDYYTAWAHQIKTPISSMRLHLQNEDSALSRTLSADLFRIEQYVEMVLMFIRLDSETTDYVFRSCDLDTLIRQSVKKFSGEFILKKLRLNYEPLHTTVITDEKWLSFVIEQVLSNALKYTSSGSITIRLEQPDVLCISDTGIGIAKEDLPRIFEKGYTGYNGRADKTSSGIGLYLCKRICKNLGHSITAESLPDVGTTIRICLNQQNTDIE